MTYLNVVQTAKYFNTLWSLSEEMLNALKIFVKRKNESNISYLHLSLDPSFILGHGQLDCVSPEPFKAGRKSFTMPENLSDFESDDDDDMFGSKEETKDSETKETVLEAKGSCRFTSII